MSTHKATIESVEISEHPNADRLEIAKIRGYQAIVAKGQYKTGDMVAYIPEQSIVPDDVIDELGLTGKLAGSKANRVKTVKLRGVVSQGLVYPITGKKLKNPPISQGQDVTGVLGITKYEPPIPSSMSGEVHSAYGKTIKYDIENIKNYPDIFEDGDQVSVTEKIHGTFVTFGIWKGDDDNEWIIHSKGLGEKGLAFNLENDNCVYVQMFHEMRVKLDELDYRLKTVWPNRSWYLCGEIFGPGVQDMHYGKSKKGFRAFDLFTTEGRINEGEFLNAVEFQKILFKSNIPTTPFIHCGAYDKEFIKKITDGRTHIIEDSQAQAHIREGVVIRPLTKERTHPEIGRVILKSVSEDYLTRHSGTEFN